MRSSRLSHAAVRPIALHVLCTCVGLAGVLVGGHATAQVADPTPPPAATPPPRIATTDWRAGVMPFVSKLKAVAATSALLNPDAATSLKQVVFTIAPKPNSHTRPVTAAYTLPYLLSRGYVRGNTLTVPVFGLYAGYDNTVGLTYTFTDGSITNESLTITTEPWADPAGYNKKQIVQSRAQGTNLSYDFFLVKGYGGGFSPTLLDTDGEIRWVSPAWVDPVAPAFYRDRVYVANRTQLLAIELDGEVTVLTDLAPEGVAGFHHNIDAGKTGMLVEVDTASETESVIKEISPIDGSTIRTWDLGSIISHEMQAGGDDPGQFVYAAPKDWFHSNAVTYRKSDNTLVVSSRENFVIALDYDTGAIRWILGDPTKKWYRFNSLRQYALAVAPGGHYPIGQHAVSFTRDDQLLLMDNGRGSILQQPGGAERNYSASRRYALDLANKVVTETSDYDANQSIYNPYCGSVYEDASANYLVDYSNNPSSQQARIIGLDESGAKVFDYAFPAGNCNVAFNSVPVHWENLTMDVSPASAPPAQLMNISTRGQVQTGDRALIGGFIVAGTDPQRVLLRAIGPSLNVNGLPLAGQLADPTLELRDRNGDLITSSDNWRDAPNGDEIEATALAPADERESAILRTLDPGSYTLIMRGKDDSTGIGLLEAYNMGASGASKLANISARGVVEQGDDAMIGGFIIGNEEASTKVVVRALGPSLAASGVLNPLQDPVLELYDANGNAFAGNDEWQSDGSATEIQKDQLAPGNLHEAATLQILSPGNYTAVVRGANGSAGVALVEIYNVP